MGTCFAEGATLGNRGGPCAAPERKDLRLAKGSQYVCRRGTEFMQGRRGGCRGQGRGAAREGGLLTPHLPYELAPSGAPHAFVGGPRRHGLWGSSTAVLRLKAV